MMRLWSHRPQLLHLGLFFAAYVLGCGFAQSPAIVPGTGISIWTPGGLFMATLVLTSMPSWPWWMLAGCLAELLGNFLWFHTPLPAALLIYAGNALEAASGAWLVNRFLRRPVRLETVQEVLAFVLLGAGLAPVIGATVGSATLAWFGVQAQSFMAAWPLWWIGDAAGVLLVAPLVLVVVQGWHDQGQVSAARWMEACVLGLILLGVAALSLSGYLPFAYIIMPPLLWAAVRFEFKGFAATLILLSLITSVFTISGASQFAGDPESQKQKQVMLQLFLAVSAFSALIVAAISRQHQQALATVRQSERELSQLVNMLPVLIRRLTPEGKTTFFNKRLVDFVGMDLAELTERGMSGLEGTIQAVIHPDDAAGLQKTIQHSLATGEGYATKYRVRRTDGVYRWMEGRGEPLRDQSGAIVQWYGISIDIDDEMRAQEALRARERELSQLVDMVPSHVWRLAPDGEPTFYNKRLVDFLGLDVTAMDKPGMSRLAAAITALVHPDDRASLANAISHSLATGERLSMRFRQRRGDGVYRWLESRAEPLRDDSGVILEWCGTNVDIDDLVRAQETLRERERELSQLVDMVPSLLWRLSPDGEPIFFNKRMVDFLGLDVADADKADTTRLAAVMEAVVHPDDAASVADALNRSLATGESFSLSYRLRRADGVYRWMSGRAEPMRDHAGRIAQWYGLCHDIDDQTRLYSDIAEREAKIRRLIDSDIIGIVIWDLDGTLIDANDAFLRMVQYGRKDVEAGLRWFDMTPPEWQEMHGREEAEELAATGKMQAREKEYFRKDGSRVPVLIGAACFEGQSRQGVAYILDLTERKHAEAALREREREFSQLVDMVPSHVWRLTPEGEPAFFNKRMVDFLGLDVVDMDKPGMSRLAALIGTSIHPEDAAEFSDTLSHCLVTGDGFAMRYRMRRVDGVYRWMSSRAEPMRDDAGRIVHWYGLCHDIDDQMHAEEALRRSERELQQLVDALPVHIWSWTPDGKLAYVNKRSLRELGLSGANLEDCARVAQELVHPKDAPEVLRISAGCLKTGDAFLMRYRRRWKDGNYRWIEARCEPLRDQDGTIVRWYQVSIDIDDEMRAQEALRNRERELSLLVDMVPVHIRRLTPEGEPVFFNKRLMDFFGVSDLAELDKPAMPRQAAIISTVIHPDDAGRLLETLGHSVATGEPYSMKYRMRHANGTYRWVDGRAEPLRDQSGAIVQWYAISIDIDDEMRAQDALRESERELSKLVDMVPSHVWRLTTDGEPTFFNKRMVDFLGRDVTDMDKPGMSRLAALMEAAVHPDDAAEFRDALSRSLVTGDTFAMRCRLRRVDDVYRWMSCRAEPMRDQGGRIIQWYGLCHDIDDQMHAEEALRQSERRYRHLFHYMPIGLTQIDASKLIPMFKELQAQGVTELKDYIDDHPEFLLRAVEALVLVEGNQHFIDMFGAKDAAEMCGPITRYWQPSIPTIRRSIEARYRGEELFQEETKLARMDGSVIDVLFTTARPGAIADMSLVGIVDITERKKAEAALREREQQLQQLIDTVPANIWCLTPEGKPSYFNKRVTDQIGLTVTDLTAPDGSLLLESIHGDDRPAVQQALVHSLKTGESFGLKYRQRRGRTDYRWTEGRAEALRDADGKIVQWYGVYLDIEDEVVAQQTLRERERFLWQLVETLPAMIVCSTPDGEPIYRSQQLREFLGYELEEFDGSGKTRLNGTLDASIHPDDVAGVKEHYAYSLSTGEPYARRHRLRRFDGAYRWVETRAAPMRGSDGAIVQWNVICFEIDGEVRAQEELRLAQEKMARASQAASLAELSASIAHEVNQPLAAIVATSHACRRWLSANPPNLERAAITLERIIRDANSASEVVSRIRALFSQMGRARSPADITGVIAEVCRLMADELAIKNIRLKTEIDRNLPPTLIDRVQIQQVLVNLIRNAIDAMDSTAGGARLIRLHAVLSGDNTVRIEVHDLGVGMNEPERAFEPFFTTKENGMGMGLAICRSIIEAHDGRLWATRNEPRGTTLAFTLPVQARNAA